jgi:very-short-patch-repair endonuclease
VKTARRLRRDQTDAEKLLWRHLRDRQCGGYKFRRQVPMGPYIADFLCIEAKLVIELDGGQHADTVVKDKRRTEYFESLGYQVIRFWNHEVIENMSGLYDSLTLTLSRREREPETKA